MNPVAWIWHPASSSPQNPHLGATTPPSKPSSMAQDPPIHATLLFRMGWTEKYEGWEMVQNASKIKSREISGKVPGQKKIRTTKNLGTKKKIKKINTTH